MESGEASPACLENPFDLGDDFGDAGGDIGTDDIVVIASE